jgi:hypothetical protein
MVVTGKLSEKKALSGILSGNFKVVEVARNSEPIYSVKEYGFSESFKKALKENYVLVRKTARSEFYAKK